MIQVWNAVKEYENGIVALEKVNCCFEYGKMYAIMGESGAGKTTLLQSIATFIPLTSGQIVIDGEPTSNLSPYETAMIRRKTIGYVFQSYLLNPKLTALENVVLPMLSEKKKYRECVTVATSLLEEVGLGEKESEYPHNLSGGEQQRISIARALANNPKIILADEPTGNLDWDNQNKIFRLLKRLSESGRCVVTVSHSKEIVDVADKVLYMRGGRLQD